MNHIVEHDLLIFGYFLQYYRLHTLAFVNFPSNHLIVTTKWWTQTQSLHARVKNIGWWGVNVGMVRWKISQHTPSIMNQAPNELALVALQSCSQQMGIPCCVLNILETAQPISWWWTASPHIVHTSLNTATPITLCMHHLKFLGSLSFVTGTNQEIMMLWHFHM